MDIHGKSVNMDMDDKFHIHGKPALRYCVKTTHTRITRYIHCGLPQGLWFIVTKFRACGCGGPLERERQRGAPTP